MFWTLFVQLLGAWSLLASLFRNYKLYLHCIQYDNIVYDSLENISVYVLEITSNSILIQSLVFLEDSRPLCLGHLDDHCKTTMQVSLSLCRKWSGHTANIAQFQKLIRVLKSIGQLPAYRIQQFLVFRFIAVVGEIPGHSVYVPIKLTDAYRNAHKIVLSAIAELSHRITAHNTKTMFVHLGYLSRLPDDRKSHRTV